MYKKRALRDTAGHLATGLGLVIFGVGRHGKFGASSCNFPFPGVREVSTNTYMHLSKKQLGKRVLEHRIKEKERRLFRDHFDIYTLLVVVAPVKRGSECGFRNAINEYMSQQFLSKTSRE